MVFLRYSTVQCAGVSYMAHVSYMAWNGGHKVWHGRHMVQYGGLMVWYGMVW